jgi:hypothetical protein
MKQTAVEWLAEQINGLDTAISLNYFKQKVEQAKEMEEQQRNHYVELSKWIIENKRSIFEEADISIESKRKILNELGYSSGDY